MMTRPGIESMARQARRYGRQVRQLEDAGMENDRARVRWAWIGFYRQLGKGYLLVIAKNAYNDEYCR
jgi:hypothetical protein